MLSIKPHTTLKWILGAFMALIITFLFGFGCGYKANSCKKIHVGQEIKYVSAPKTVTDTVKVYVPVKDISFKGNGRKVFIQDTAKATDSTQKRAFSPEMDRLTLKNPDLGTDFVSSIDTTIDSVDIAIQYASHENLFTVMLRRPPQLERTIIKTSVIPVEIIKEKEPDVIQQALYGIAFFGLGYTTHLVVQELRD